MRRIAVFVAALLCVASAAAKDVSVRHVLTLTVFDTKHKKIYALDHVTTAPTSGLLETPRVGDLIDVSIRNEVTHCVVTSATTTYVLDPGTDPTVSVSVALTQTP